MEWITDPHAWVALATLTALEIVLGVDNIIFISILVGRLPEARRKRARTLGLALAAGTRIALLLSIAWVMSLTDPWFEILGKDFSGRDVILRGVAFSCSGKAFMKYTARWKARRTRRAGSSAPQARSPASLPRLR